MSMQMTRTEREAFLAGVRVGVLSIAEPGRGPLMAPMWYGYQPGGELWFITDAGSRKGRLLRQAERLSLCVQTETKPYQYVSVEGPVTSVEPCDVERDPQAMARRYLGDEAGERYLATTGGAAARANHLKVTMRPARWLTADYARRT